NSLASICQNCNWLSSLPVPLVWANQAVSPTSTVWFRPSFRPAPGAFSLPAGMWIHAPRPHSCGGCTLTCFPASEPPNLSASPRFTCANTSLPRTPTSGRAFKSLESLDPNFHHQCANDKEMEPLMVKLNLNVKLDLPQPPPPTEKVLLVVLHGLVSVV